MTRPSRGIWVAPEVRLSATVGFKASVRSQAHIHDLTVSTGSTPGNCRVSFPSLYAEDASVEHGAEASVRVGNKVVFRGVVLGIETISTEGDDQVELYLADDKYRMARFVIGQPSVHTQGYGIGFRHVGLDLIFNKDGRPNQQDGSLDFDVGSTAVPWTYKSVLQFIASYYLDSDLTINIGSLNADWNEEVSSLDLTGQNAAQAINTLASLVGQNWGLHYTTSGSKVVAIPPGGYGTKRKATLFSPGSQARAAQAGEWGADENQVSVDVGEMRDVHYAMSAPELVEATYATGGDDPLLIHSASFSAPLFAHRLEVDVTKYAVQGLGQSLTVGSSAKPWASSLVRRLNAAGTDYLTDPDLPGGELDPQLWYADAVDGQKVLIASGYDIDLQNGYVYLEESIEVFAADGQKQAVEGLSYGSLFFWLTIATRLETRVSAFAGEDNPYLAEPRASRVDYPDLLPTKVLSGTLLPDLSDLSVQLAQAETEYIYDPGADLTRHAQSALRLTKEPQVHMGLTLPYFPLCEIGNPLALSRALGQLGAEYITRITYTMHDGYQTRLQARNVPGGKV